MYVCVCNGIKEKDVRAHVKKGADTVGRVFRAHGCKPQCATCINCVRKTIDHEMSQQAPSDVQAAE